MMRPGTTCACHDSSIPHICGYLKHNQPIRPHPDHAVGSTLSISMPDPPVSWSLHSPDSCVCTRPHLRAPPITLPIRSSPSSTPPRSFIHHFIGIHSTVHSSRDKHHADPCCPHTNPRRSALSTSTSTSTKRPCQPQPARTSNEQNKNGVPAHMRGNAVHLTEKSTRVGLPLIHQHHMGGFQPRPDRCLDNARTHTLELGDHLGGLVDLSLRGTPLQRHQTPLRLQ